MSMGKLRQVFLFSNPDIEFIEYCLLPYINLPDSHSLFPDGCIDVFYIQNGKVELMFNTLPSKELSSGEFIFLSRQCTDYFIVSGGRDAVIIHARIILHGLYKDLLLHHGLYNRLHILNRNNSDALPAASEMIKLLLNMKRVQSGAVLFLEPPVTLFFVHLYLNEIAGLLLPFNNYDQRFSKLMLEIIKNPDYPWHVKDMAREHCMSTNFFISEFRKTSGFTPFNFLKKIRLNKGRQLLENTDIPVSVIARQCGYNSHASFTFYIKQEFGFPPLKIRKNAQLKYDIIVSEDKSGFVEEIGDVFD